MPSDGGARVGVAAALGAYLIWGVFGLYFHSLAALPAPEVLAHRILGGAGFALLLLLVTGQGAEARAVLVSRRRLGPLLASSAAIAINWGLYIWAVANGRALEASMGYFLYPLISVVLARVVLGEAMSRRQGLAVAVVALGVGWLVASGTGVPWVALVLGASFGTYGLLRKQIAVGALTGLFVEALVLAPAALAYLVWAGGGMAPRMDGATQGLLALAGPVTAVPLVLFAMGARRLRLSTMGLLMYINPTVQMLVAVLVLGEGFSSAHAVAFAAIWLGLGLYSWPASPAKAVASRRRSI
jgi:chloramphenicol-sensitive protein RarD